MVEWNSQPKTKVNTHFGDLWVPHVNYEEETIPGLISLINRPTLHTTFDDFRSYSKILRDYTKPNELIWKNFLRLTSEMAPVAATFDYLIKYILNDPRLNTPEYWAITITRPAKVIGDSDESG